MKFNFLILFVLISNWGWSQESPTSIAPKNLDSVIQKTSKKMSSDTILKMKPYTNSLLDVKTFRSNYRKNYQSKDFDYSQSKPRESLWDRVMRKVNKLIHYILSKINPTQSLNWVDALVKIMALLVVGVALYFIIKFLASKNGLLFLGKKAPKTNIQNRDVVENIHEIDFPKTISTFELEKNYRAAVRYQFLWVLKKLSDKKIIDWHLEKTNKDYAEELSKISIHPSFLDLVKIFDFVWYGEFEIDQYQYRQFQKQFENFKI